MSSGAGLATAVALESHGELGEIEAVKARGYWEQVWLRFRRDKVAIAGGVFVIVLIIVAFIGAPIAQRILGHGPNEIFAGRARSRLAASGRTADVDHDGAISRRGRQLRGHVLRARRRFAARPGHVPTVALRRPDLVAGGRAGDVPLRLHRARDGPDGGLLPRHGGHDRLPVDGDRDGLPSTALHHRRRRHGRRAPEHDHLRRPDPARGLHAGHDLRDLRLVLSRPGSSAPRSSRCARRSSSRRLG